MFDLPEAKRVRRSDLYTHSRSSSASPSPPDPSLVAKFQNQLAQIYGIVPPTAPLSPEDGAPGPSADTEEMHDAEDAQDDDQGFEFRLFSSAKPAEKDNPQTHKIVITDEDADWGDGAFVVPHRELSYYIIPKAEGDRRRGIELMAMSGEDILREKSRRHWGLEVPWRVKVLKVQGTVKKRGVERIVTMDQDAEEMAKRKKPGKKRRIILRERKKIKDEAEQKRKIAMEMKEEAEKEKRIRRNREKKIKRRLKEKAEKAKKAGLGDVNTDADGDAQSDASMDGMDVSLAAED
ncbi:hypothetical protein BP5796_00073 [Coleophoma crateriformis]|uniref:Uncharacterized protein n=1 Tax=Coleophoma crateriformis TaxID=565419 RepID=A0A3D8T707_9HELO|nr:hypothetical protein BP5796_00073 [Coleophoma crateriformis]